MHVEDMANKGKYSFDFRRLNRIDQRDKFNYETGRGSEFIFHVRENYCDLTFLNSFIDQEFVDRYKLMVVGQRINSTKNRKEYYVKSRKMKDYKSMLIDSLYHPPYIKFFEKDDGTLYLNHLFEEKELYRDYIPNTMIGLEYLWGNKVQLETMELDWEKINKELDGANPDEISRGNLIFRKVLYTVKNKEIKKEVL